LEIHWQILNVCTNGQQFCDPSLTQYVPVPVSQSFHHSPSMTPVSLYGRYTNYGPTIYNSPNYTCTYYTGMLTRLTVVNADGTETELRDAQYDGQPLSGGGGNRCTDASSRGTVFKSSDGSALTFISDAPVYDQIANGTYMSQSFSGYLITRDGTRFRIVNGAVTWMEDRNGNKIDFLAGTDSLGRSIPALTQHPDGNLVDQYDTIAFAGFGGAARTITVTYANLHDVLRSDYTLQTYHGLFPNLNGASSYSNFDPRLVASVTIPNGQQYQFKYDSYGELARVDLPSGGRVEYDFGGSYSNQNIVRNVTARRVFSDAGVTPADSTTYSYAQVTSPPTTITTVDHLDVGGALIAREKHYYTGFVGEHNYIGATNPTIYDWWREGREYQTEEYAVAGGVAGPLLRSTAQQWQQRATVSWCSSCGDQSPSEDPRVFETDATLSDTNQVSKQTYSYDDSVPFNNRSDVYEYDYGTGAAGGFLRRTHTDYVTASAYVTADVNPAVGASLRSLPSQQWVSTDIAGNNKASLTAYSYDQSAPTDCPGITGHDAAYSTGFTTRGDVTGVTRYSNAATSAGAITSASQYDVAGNIVSATDPLGNTSYVSYADSFCNDGGVRCGGTYAANTYAFPSGTTSPVPDASAQYSYPAGTFGSTSSLTASRIYDYYTGSVYSATDANNKTTTLYYADSQGNLDQLDRLKAVVRPDGGRTDFNYFDTVGNLYVQVLSDLDAGRRTESRQYFDGLGRGVRSFRWENQDASNQWLTTDTQYDMMGRAYKVSSPYRSPGPGSAVSPSRGWTQNTFDALGRVTQVTTTADGAFATTSYNGNTVTVTDQHDPSNPNAPGHSRESVTDALGRMTDVYEDPSGANYHTVYTYDALDDLLTVTQAGQQNGQQVTQTRTFGYDSLSRLKSANNPESGTVSYTYDNDGNIHTKTDARGVVSTYSYDHLNRNIITTYATAGTGAAQTPTVFRYYDFATNGLGKPYRSEAQATAQTTFTAYDAMGRATDSQQKFWVSGAWGQAYSVHQGYNFAGGVTTETYPSGHTVSYNYDAAGRVGDNSVTGLPAFSGNLGDAVQRTYASQVLYDQAGGMSQERFATDMPLYHKLLYNSRSQLAEIRVGTASLPDTGWQRGAIINQYSASGWGATAAGKDNNGNLREQDLFVPNIDGAGYDQGGNWTGATQTFSYDPLNRLSRASESSAASWTQGYVYDRWGNRTIDQNVTIGTPLKPQFELGPQAPDQEVAEPSNRLYGQGDNARAASQKTMRYDAAGNLVYDIYQGGLGGGGTRSYDAENRMVTAQINSTQSAAYTYDADGRRMKRNTGWVEVWQVYGLGGELLAEYAPNASPGTPQEEYGYRGGELLVTATVTGGWGPAPTLDDNPLNPHHSGETPIRLAHITQLRSAIDSLRSHLGLPPYSWSAAPCVGDTVTTAPITEMRAAIDQALGPPPAPGYTGGLASTQPILAKHIQELRDRVLGAWQGGVVGADVRWLVPDQLGTPRIIIDHTGSLAGVTRHDYLPFGEEIPADGSWRTAARGYGAGDGVRQKFTGKERDYETDLDFLEARYFNSTQGRFTSPDPLYYTATRPGDPQQFNLYSYVRNNPLIYTDPDGKDLVGVSWHGGVAPITEDDRRKLQTELRKLAPGTKVDAEGHVHKPGFFHRIINNLTGHGAGTRLVSNLVDSEKTTAVIVTNTSVSATRPKGDFPPSANIDINGARADVYVWWGAGKGQPSTVLRDGVVKDEPTPIAIALGHELIHAEHMIDGTYTSVEQQAVRTFNFGGTTYQETRSAEEFRTVGYAGFTNRGDITENQLRKELGVPPRIAYNPRSLWRPVN
jgi:RHS repeat-associated protein